MKVKLSKNAFVRHFGPYCYLYNQISKVDEIYKDAAVFVDTISHRTIDVELAVQKIVSQFSEIDLETARKDYIEFISHLEQEGFVVTGETGDELNRKDHDFTYQVESPMTASDLVGINLDAVADDEHKLLKSYFEEHPTPFGIHLDLTSECNERCVHCYVPKTKHFYLDAGKACEVLDQFQKMEGLQVTVSGGECLLHPEFERIIHHAKDLGLSISVLSNLTLMNERTARLFKDINLSLVQVSLYSMDPTVHDGITKLKGSFEKSKRAIELLYRMDVPVQIACPCMKANYRGYRSVIEYAQSMRMKAVSDFIMMARSDGTTDNLNNRLNLDESEYVMRTILQHEPEMRAALKEDRPENDPIALADKPMCGVGIDSICLNADGNYYACSGFQGYPLGSCFEQSLSEVWNNSPQIKYLRGLRKRDIPQCINCKDSGYCAMCLVRNFNETGDMLKVSEHFCRVAKLNHDLVSEYRNGR